MAQKQTPNYLEKRNWNSGLINIYTKIKTPLFNWDKKNQSVKNTQQTKYEIHVHITLKPEMDTIS